MKRLHVILPAVLLCVSGTTFAETQAPGTQANNPNPGPKADHAMVESSVGGLQRNVLAHKIFSPDKRLFAGYYRDGWDEVISIHDAKSGKQLTRIVGHGDEVRELKFTPDGKLLASRCVNRGRKGWALWNVSTGELVLRLPVPPGQE